MSRRGKYIGEGQLCWTCKNFAIGCEWSESKANKPVDGWTAEEVPFMTEDTTFKITDCPKYEFDGENVTCDDCVFNGLKIDRSQYNRCGLCAYNPEHKGEGDSLKETY